MPTQRFHVVLITFALVIVSIVPLSAGEKYTQKIALQNDGNLPFGLDINSGMGDITIVGYTGSEVIIEAETDNKLSLPPEDNEKAKGLKRIAGSGFNVSYNNDDSIVIITRPLEGNTKLDLKVPHNMYIKIGHANLNMGVGDSPYSIYVTQKIRKNKGVAFFQTPGCEGNVTIRNISGTIEVNTQDGDILVDEATGSVIANAVNGDITMTFTGKPHNKPMAFSTIAGDVDVTLPKNITATIRANNVDGDVYTDFDMEVTPGEMSNVQSDRDVMMMGMFGNAVTGKINGGGPEIRMTTVEGSIYIRKGK